MNTNFGTETWGPAVMSIRAHVGSFGAGKWLEAGKG